MAKDKTRGMDLGKVLLWSAVLVESPRWAGAMLAADVSEVEPWLSTVLNIANALAGFAMGIVVVVATAYLLDALRRTKPMMAVRRNKETVERANPRFWGLLVFVVGLLTLTPFVLGPYIVSRMTGETIAVVLVTLTWQYVWSVAVVIAPAFVIGGVAFAQPGLVTLSSDQSSVTSLESDGKKGGGGGKVAGKVSETAKETVSVAASDRPQWRDWRDVPESEYARIASMTVDQIMRTYGRPERTARNWVKSAKEAVNGGKPLQEGLFQEAANE